jgi:hypothetical protein
MISLSGAKKAVFRKSVRRNGPAVAPWLVGLLLRMGKPFGLALKTPTSGALIINNQELTVTRPRGRPGTVTFMHFLRGSSQ